MAQENTIPQSVEIVDALAALRSEVDDCIRVLKAASLIPAATRDNAVEILTDLNTLAGKGDIDLAEGWSLLRRVMGAMLSVANKAVEAKGIAVPA